MCNMYTRIEALCKERNTTITGMCREIGVARTILSEYKSGRTKTLSSNVIGKIADYFGVTVDYLLTGKSESASTFDNLAPVSQLKRKKVPLLGDIACGEPIYAEESLGDFIWINDDIDADFCLTCHGDSMTGARIMDGDLVFIKKQDMVDNGQIAAVIIENEATLKRVYYYPEQAKLVLGAENPKYEPFVYVGEELNRIRILGRAVAFQSYVR